MKKSMLTLVTFCAVFTAMPAFCMEEEDKSITFYSL